MHKITIITTYSMLCVVLYMNEWKHLITVKQQFLFFSSCSDVMEISVFSPNIFSFISFSSFTIIFLISHSLLSISHACDAKWARNGNVNVSVELTLLDIICLFIPSKWIIATFVPFYGTFSIKLITLCGDGEKEIARKCDRNLIYFFQY
jgi:hypothetical protein